MARGHAPSASARKAMSRRTWWTRARVIAGLQHFYRERGWAPINTHDWHEATRTPGFRGGSTGARRAYPSQYAVLRHFSTFREAWTACGVAVDRGYEEWSELDLWYLREATGILSRTEIARDLGRTPDAVHRRQYDLGLNAREHWGWTLNRLERLTSIQRHVWQRYMDWGDLPYFRGNKCLYVDPGDLTVVEELDCSKLSAELEEAMRRSLRKRLLLVLARQDWRAGRIYQPHRMHGLSRIHNRRVRVPQKPGPRPSGIEKGDPVRVVGNLPARHNLAGRIGLVHFVYWAFARTGTPTRKSTDGAWMGRVEFKSQHGRSKGPRVTYSIPLEFLERVGPTDKRHCTCGAVIVWRADERPPDACGFCAAPVAEVTA